MVASPPKLGKNWNGISSNIWKILRILILYFTNFATMFHFSLSDECSWTQFKNCLPYFNQTNASLCMENCLPSCDHIRYFINIAPNDKWFDHQRCKSELIIGASTFQYTRFTEKLQWTFYSFASGLGGMLGIWLGLDLFFFIERIISIANWLLTITKNLLKMKKTVRKTNTVKAI